MPERDPRTEVGTLSVEPRTPLAAISGFAERYRHGATADTPRLMGRIESESIRMGRLAQDLLLLARLDEDRELQLGRVDLVPLAVDAEHDARVLQPDRTVRLDLDCAARSGLRGGVGDRAW